MTWQAAHSWKEESAKSGVMLFKAVAAYCLNKAGGYRDREPAQIRNWPPDNPAEYSIRVSGEWKGECRTGLLQHCHVQVLLFCLHQILTAGLLSNHLRPLDKLSSGQTRCQVTAAYELVSQNDDTMIFTAIKSLRYSPMAWARAMTTSWQDVSSDRPHTTRTTPSTHTLSSIRDRVGWVEG